MAITTRRLTFAFMAAAPWAISSWAAESPKPPKPTFVPLGEFTINLPDEGSMGYVVIGITLEAAPDAATDLNDIAPRLKDLCISRLMAMAAQGMLAPGHTDLVMIKASLFDSISKLRPNGVREILITRLLYG
ncbi:MAG TPA: flagellar basal body-associated FliL family protein [Rhodopila sp.]|nr:flagellar basal body-associated FliL family protein [Rhodopila sp.]